MRGIGTEDENTEPERTMNHGTHHTNKTFEQEHKTHEPRKANQTRKRLELARDATSIETRAPGSTVRFRSGGLTRPRLDRVALLFNRFGTSPPAARPHSPVSAFVMLYLALSASSSSRFAFESSFFSMRPCCAPGEQAPLGERVRAGSGQASTSRR